MDTGGPVGRRKIFVGSELSSKGDKHSLDGDGYVSDPLEVVPPADTKVHFDKNTSKIRRFDFGEWYGVGIDPITHACQLQIQRFLDRRELEVETVTIVSYCINGLRHLLRYLVVYATAVGRTLDLRDINRDMVDGYLAFLRDKGFSIATQQVSFSYTKAVLVALGRRGVFELIIDGDDMTFPRNPFSGSHRHVKGESPLTQAERNAFTSAVKRAAMPLLASDAEPNGTVLAYALLIVALHTGRNATPLLEMRTGCLQPHPRDDLEFLVLTKRRGHTTSKVVLRAETTAERTVELTPTLRPSVSRLIHRVVELTESVRREAPADMRDYVWLYRSKAIERKGQIVVLASDAVAGAIDKLVRDYHLVDSDGKALRINISRLRKTFTNRINEILGDDVVTTAVAAGNTAPVTARHYLRPGETAKRNWQFMGVRLVEELLSETLGASERTPVGRCSDTKAGEYAPKRDGAVCESFLNCLRCRNYVVTGDDLWRLYSFYWRVLRERPRIDSRRWNQRYGHIPRLIERDVVAVGIAQKVFKKSAVLAARERARNDPHPFWASQTILGDLESLR